MISNRREFLLTAGATALTAAGYEVFAEGQAPKIDDKKRWAMAIDIKKCQAHEGCNDCMAACHSIHNVPDLRLEDGSVDKQHEIKWIWKAPFKNAFPTQEHPHLKEEIVEGDVPVMCNHCENPSCVRVCPTKATFQRADGIVAMDYHRCIGCRFCMAACPYGSRSFNFGNSKEALKEAGVEFDSSYPARMRGVVEKCNFCAERLRRGKTEEERTPKCVTVCKYDALAFGDLGDSDSPIAKLLQERFSIRRKPSLGTDPQVYYLV